MRYRNLLILSLTLLLVGCRKEAKPPSIATAPPPAAKSEGEALFTNVTQSAGIDFTFTNGAKGRHYLIETTGSGCAFFDYDNDGYPDILLLQAGELPNTPNPRKLTNRLYHNLGNGKFQDVTAGSGVEITGYNQGLAVGDYDSDGYDDLFTTAFGGNHLFHNEKGTGKFTEVTAKAHLSDTERGARWCTSAAFGDYDNDGKLDLYVCRYAVWNPEKDKPCKNPKGQSSYCSPELYAPEEHILYHNNGDGTFTPITESLGDIAQPHVTRGLAVGDFDNDGNMDVLANNQDGAPELLKGNFKGGHWFALETHGTKSNRNGYHAKVTLTAGGKTYFAEVRSGSSFGSHSHSRLYFGLGEATKIDSLKVVWHGSKTVTQAQNVTADATYSLTEGKSLEPLHTKRGGGQ